jgi:uncharacterized OB-fold protein
MMSVIPPGKRPGPSPSDLTAPFWEHAARRELVRQRCDVCGSSFFTPKMACPFCLSVKWTWVPSAGQGSVYTYTVCHRAPAPGFDVPYVLAVVDLSEGWSMLTNIVGCDPVDVSIGMKVQVAWLELDPSTVLPVFEPRRS